MPSSDPHPLHAIECAILDAVGIEYDHVVWFKLESTNKSIPRLTIEMNLVRPEAGEVERVTRRYKLVPADMPSIEP